MVRLALQHEELIDVCYNFKFSNLNVLSLKYLNDFLQKASIFNANYHLFQIQFAAFKTNPKFFSS